MHRLGVATSLLQVLNAETLGAEDQSLAGYNAEASVADRVARELDNAEIGDVLATMSRFAQENQVPPGALMDDFLISLAAEHLQEAIHEFLADLKMLLIAAVYRVSYLLRKFGRPRTCLLPQ